MILLVLTGIGVGSALFTWERVKRLAALPITGLSLVWVAIILQTVLFEYLGQHLPLWASNGIHFITYGLCLVFLWRNRHLPGGLIIAVGAGMNLLAIAANGGAMPANMEAWRRAGLPDFPPEVFENSRALSSPRLGFLGDIFYVPADWPLSNVFSIGDVLIVVGGTYLAHKWCASSPDEIVTDEQREAVIAA